MQHPVCKSLTLELPQGTACVTAELIRCSAKNYTETSLKLESLRQPWQTLAGEAQAANPFLEPWSLMPALQHLAQEAVDLLVVWQDDQQQKMLLLVPLLKIDRFHQIPLQHRTLWRHPYCYLCTPLISPQFPLNGWLPLLAAIKHPCKLGDCVTHGWLTANELIEESKPADATANWHIHLDRGVKSRAGLTLEGDFAAYLGSLRTKKRKDLQRSRRRISELGDLSVSVIDSQSHESQQLFAVDEFLSLENSGWKNAANTAIACDKNHELFFRTLIRNGLHCGQLLMMRMALNNQAVAVLVVLVSACGRCGYTLKIATDAKFSKYSLGSQVILAFTEHAFANLDLRLLDSCAAENHPMINALWKHRIRLDNLTLVKKNNWRNLVVSGVRWLRAARQTPE